MKTVVIALGGNAIAPKKSMSVSSEFSHTRAAMMNILPIIKNNKTVITHGNGPQVGNILIRSEEALGKAYSIPLSVAVAESEGEIGYIIEQSLMNAISKHRLNKTVISILTQVVVDKKDKAFKKPTKPIGPFYSEQDARKMMKKGVKMVFEKGKGWRRVVPSPKPVRIVEVDIIKRMPLNVVTIAAGGGGIPVIKKGNSYFGVDAVIDKDLASACLAKSINADLLFIITDVPCAYKNFGTKNEPIGKISSKEMRVLAQEGHFSSGSMLPKVEAAIDFAEAGGISIITNIESAKKALSGRAGTIVKK